MARRRAGTVLVAAMVIMLAVAGCMGKDKALQPTETSAQATQRVDELWEEAFDQLPSGVTTERNLSLDALSCDAPTDGGPDGRIFVERRAQVVAPASSSWSVTEVLPTFSAFWQRKGYKVITDDHIVNEHRYTVQTGDGYQLMIRTYDRGGRYDVYVGVNSPCVWEFGTPDPQ